MFVEALVDTGTLQASAGNIEAPLPQNYSVNNLYLRLPKRQTISDSQQSLQADSGAACSNGEFSIFIGYRAQSTGASAGQ